MTRDEFYAKYGKFLVVFHSYYKYTFYYRGILPGNKTLTVGWGGNADDIYRREVLAGEEKEVFELQPHYGAVYENGEKIDGFYDY